VAKLVRPGDRVDIITSIEYNDGKSAQREVKTMLQDVLVLATGLNVTNNIPRALQLDAYNGKPSFRNLNGDTSFSSITLEVSPQEAQNIIYIMSVAPGSMFLSLRNPNDRTTPRLATSNLDNVLGVDSAKALQRKLAQAQADAAAAQAAARSQPQQQKPRGFIEIRGSDVKY
jgi:pilus assembly protein CpaB